MRAPNHSRAPKANPANPGTSGHSGKRCLPTGNLIARTSHPPCKPNAPGRNRVASRDRSRPPTVASKVRSQAHPSRPRKAQAAAGKKRGLPAAPPERWAPSGPSAQTGPERRLAAGGAGGGGGGRGRGRGSGPRGRGRGNGRGIGGTVSTPRPIKTFLFFPRPPLLMKIDV